MRYPEAVDALRALRSRRPEMGTAATASLLDALGRPQDGVDVVQIAGTNGKGSTAELLSNVLQRAGLTVGVFTSPALNDLREQVRIDGRPVPKARFVAYIEDLLAHLDGLDETDQPTRFEALTALAVTHFGREDVDVAVLEVGIGGRYDSTSAVTPVASAVTTVSREHTDLLGEDVADIAREQAQVAPPDRPLVTGATGDALDAIRADTDAVTVGERDADVVARETGMRNDVESAVELVGPDWRVDTALSLLGQHQAVNAGVAAALARQLVDVDAETVARGLRATTWPGRFEIVERDPFVVLDGAHNPGAVSTLSRLLERYERDELHVVFGSMADKEYDRMVARLPDVDVAYVTRPETERAEGTAALADAFDGHADEVRDVASVGEATERAVAAAGTDDVVLVTGSLYVVGEARDRWTRALVPKHAARNPGEARALDDAAFENADVADVAGRLFTVPLREAGADAVERRLDALGGTCLTSSVGAPGRLVAAALSGSEAQFRALADGVEDEDVGLGWFADALRAHLDGGARVPDVVGAVRLGGDDALARARRASEAGAATVDLAVEPSWDVETAVERVAPVVEALAADGVDVAVTTRRAPVAAAALDAGATAVRDESGLADPEMRFVVAERDATLALAPVAPAARGPADDVVADARSALAERVLVAERAGISRSRVRVEPRGATAADARALLARAPELHGLGCAVGANADATTAAIAAWQGVDAVRVEAVTDGAEAVRAVAALLDAARR